MNLSRRNDRYNIGNSCHSISIGLLGLVFVESISVQQPAEAKGCDILSGEHTSMSSTAFNAGIGRCFNG
ncbi:MAG: hypothetical protein ACJ72J_03205 [Nitrososphaeraceae archaeon]